MEIIRKTLVTATVISAFIIILYFIQINSKPDDSKKLDHITTNEYKALNKVSEKDLTNKKNTGKNTQKKISDIISSNPSLSIEKTDNLSEIYSILSENAKNGDDKSALYLARALFKCFNTDLNEADISKEFKSAESIYENSEIGSELSEYAINHMSNSASNSYFCSGISLNQSAEYYNFLKISADLGNIDAQIEISVYAPPELNNSDSKNIEIHLEQYLKEKEHYLSIAASKGNEKAMMLLAFEFKRKKSSSNDIIMAYAYSRALSEKTKDGKLNQSMTTFNLQVKEEMTPEQIIAAEEKYYNIKNDLIQLNDDKI